MTIGRLPFINPSQVLRCLAVLWAAGIPTALIGGVGTGKTSTVHQFVELLRKQSGKKTVNLWTLILSYLSPEEIGGVPAPNRESGHLDYYMPGFLPFDCSDSGVIFGDEFDRATPEVQNAFLQVLLGKEFHGHTLSPSLRGR